MLPVRLAILASGSGTNAENIIRYFSTNKWVEVGVVISNKSEAQVHARARKYAIPSYTLTREELMEGHALLEKLEMCRVDFVILAGYLLKVPEVLIFAYPNRIINIHPALLPKYGGKGMYGNHIHQAVLDHKELETGITIHLVNKNYDEGSILFQARCPVSLSDSVEEVATKVHELEYAHYPKVIGDFLQKEFDL